MVQRLVKALGRLIKIIFLRIRNGLKFAFSRYLFSNSVVRQAVEENEGQIEKMFRTFLPAGESILGVYYLGEFGIWGLERRNWACVTESRVCGIEVTPWRGVNYQQIYGDRINSISYYQPSFWLIFLFCGIFTLATVVFLSEMFLFEAFADSLEGVVNSISDLPGDYWYEFWHAASIGFFLPILVAFSLLLSRKIIKRGVQIAGDGVTVSIFADRRLTPNTCRFIHEASELRSRCIRLIAIR